MNKLRYTYIYHICTLKYVLKSIFGPHYPTELVKMIIMINYIPIQISCGDSHTVLVCNKVYVWGNDTDGQLGLYSGCTISVPTELCLMGANSVSCGSFYTIVSTTSNKSYGWGTNYSGQLGINYIDCVYYLPQKITLPDSIIKINCGGYHAMALTKDAELYGWGHNLYGQLGLGHPYNQLSPTKLVLSEPCREIICGQFCTIVLSTSNKIYVWGSNISGQLGLGDYNDRYVPHELILIGSEPIVSVSCGYNHSMALTKSKIYVWGSNSRGQLGLGHRINQNVPQELIIENSNIIAVCCGESHTLALTASDQIYVWGQNNQGQLGLGHTDTQSSPQKLLLVGNFTNIVCGGNHSIAQTSDKIYVWGLNNCGQLGLGHKIDQSVPTELEF